MNKCELTKGFNMWKSKFPKLGVLSPLSDLSFLVHCPPCTPSLTMGSQPHPSPRSSPFSLTCLVVLTLLFACKGKLFLQGPTWMSPALWFLIACPCMILFHHRLYCIEWGIHCPLPHQTTGCQKDRVVWFAAWPRIQSAWSDVSQWSRAKSKCLSRRTGGKQRGRASIGATRSKLPLQNPSPENFWPANFPWLLKGKRNLMNSVL